MLDKTPGRILDYHRSMLADTTRTHALERAIAETVRPGDRVLDLGCGTGILTCFACRAGAARVYAVEAEEVIELARGLCRANGFSDRVVFLEGLSLQMQVPEPVDLVVSETIGNIGLDEGIVGWILDARRRFLRPGGRVIPRAVELSAAPVELPRVAAEIESWEGLPYGLDLSFGRRLAANTVHWVELAPEDVLGAPVALARVDLQETTTDRLDASVVLQIERGGLCHGLGVWFNAELTERLSLSNAPPLQTPSWRHGFLPLAVPLSVSAGDRLVLTLAVRGNGALWRWRLSRLDAEGREDGRADQSTFHGQLDSLESLRRSAPGSRPRLKPQGESDRFILEQMNGTATVSEIAARVAVRFPDQFPVPELARQRVRQLVRRYGH